MGCVQVKPAQSLRSQPRSEFRPAGSDYELPTVSSVYYVRTPRDGAAGDDDARTGPMAPTTDRFSGVSRTRSSARHVRSARAAKALDAWWRPNLPSGAHHAPRLDARPTDDDDDDATGFAQSRFRSTETIVVCTDVVLDDVYTLRIEAHQEVTDEDDRGCIYWKCVSNVPYRRGREEEPETGAAAAAGVNASARASSAAGAGAAGVNAGRRQRRDSILVSLHHPFSQIAADPPGGETREVGGVVADNALTRALLLALGNVRSMHIGATEPKVFAAVVIRMLTDLWD